MTNTESTSDGPHALPLLHALTNGKEVTITLRDLKEQRDSVRHAMREARVTIDVNGKPATLLSGNYQLPVAVAGAAATANAMATRTAESRRLTGARMQLFSLWYAANPAGL